MKQKNKQNKSISQTMLVKQLNKELMQVTYVAMLEGTDLQGDYISADEVRKAKESFNRSMQRANLFHIMMTDKFFVEESYLAPTDLNFGGVDIKKGTWLITLQINDEDLWEMIKTGEINGISIGAMASIEEYEDESEEQEEETDE